MLLAVINFAGIFIGRLSAGAPTTASQLFARLLQLRFTCSNSELGLVIDGRDCFPAEFCSSKSNLYTCKLSRAYNFEASALRWRLRFQYPAGCGVAFSFWINQRDQLENKVDSDRLEHEQSSDSQSQASHEAPGGTNAANSNHKCTAAAGNTVEEAVKQPDITIEQVDRGGISHIVSEEVTHNPITADQESQPDLKVNITSTIREKVSEDGYNWRKYGQKLVKGNVFVRSYYRCTYPTCMVKKQLERTHDWKITDTVYFGQHDHPKLQSHIPVPIGVVNMVEEKSDEHASRSSQDKASIALGQTPHKTEPTGTLQLSLVVASDNVKDEALKRSRNNDDVDYDDTPDLNREKKRCNLDATVADKSTVESRVVVVTPSEGDIVNDGYRWRKYGQKLVKGNANPRSYYRCSSPGCPVKKHVERASHDPKVVRTTYEGHHDHDMPPSRTVTLNSVGSTAAQSDETMKTKSVGSSIGHDMAVHASKDPQTNSSSESKLIEKNGKSNATEANDGIILDMVVVPVQELRVDKISS